LSLFISHTLQQWCSDAEKREKLQQITDAVITAQENERTFLGEELHDNINPLLATAKAKMVLIAL